MTRPTRHIFLILHIVRKFFSLTLSAIVVLLISGFVSLKPISFEPVVLASHDPNCVDIQKVDGKDLTDPILSDGSDGSEEGISDSGQMDFDDPDTSTSYHGCVERTQRSRTLPAPSGMVSGNFWNGWVWNTNIGYISFSCEGGVNPNPGGSACGSVEYGTLSDLAGHVSGFAWADNIGWISMSCEEGENLGVSCGSVDYGVQIAQQNGYDPSTDPSNPITCTRMDNNNGPAGTLNAGDMYGYAWNDSVGWINFCGASARYSYTGDLSIVKVSFSTGAELDPAATIYANGDDAYEIRLTIRDENGTIVNWEGNPAYRVFIIDLYEYDYANNREWYIRTDQVTPCTFPTQINCRATRPTANGFQWDATNQRYYLRTSSVAPSDSDANQHIFAGLSTIVYDTQGTPADQGDDIALYTIVNTTSYPFTFAPAIQLTQIESEESPGVFSSDGIQTIANTSQHIRLTARRPAAQGFLPPNNEINIHSYVYDCSNQYEFVFDGGGDGFTPLVDVENAPSPAPNRGTIAEANSFYCNTATPSEGGFSDTISQTLSSFGNPPATFASAYGDQYIYTSDQASGSNPEVNDALAYDTAVSYTLTSDVPGAGTFGSLPTIRYLTSNLTNSTVLSQAADVRGDVSIDIRDTTGLPNSERISQSIGERAQSKREPVYRVVRSSLASRAPTNFATGSNRQVLTASELVSTATNKGIVYYRRDRNVLPAAPCTIVIESGNGSNISITGGVTLMTEGCDIYIDHNIVSGTAGQLGIIALEDLSMAGNRKGGSVYICGQVTDVEVNFVLDGSLFSYGNVNDCGDPSNKSALVDASTGYPLFASSVRDVLRNQLTIMGSLVSNNTYGGSLQNPPLTGTGEIATGTEVATARLFDLNFLRYAKTRSNPVDPIDGPPCWANSGGTNTVTLSSLITPTGLTDDQICNDLSNPNNSWTRGIVNIIYEAPSKTLPIFNSVK